MDTTHIDPRLIDQLVDGELSGEARKQLLTTLDGRPGGWRQCALAFLEAQSLRQDLTALTGRDESKGSAVIGLIDRGRSDETISAARRGLRAPRLASWLGVAAAVAVAFGFGVWWNDRFEGTALVGSSPLSEQGSPPGTVATMSPGAVDSATSGDSLVFFVRGGDGATQKVRVPLVDAGALDRQLGVRFRSGLPEAVRDELQRNGYSIYSKRRYAPLWLENGGSLVVPVEDTHIVPVSAEVY